MQIVTRDIGQMVLNELRGAVDARLAVAFFSPSNDMHAVLSVVPNLALFVSEEFTIDDPRKLAALPSHFVVRSLPTQSAKGKLHAKVLIVARADGSRWALDRVATLLKQSGIQIEV